MIGIVGCTGHAQTFPMMSIDLELDFSEYDQDVDGYVVDVLRPAIATGITAAANLVKDALIEAAGRNFDRPNAFTLKGFNVLPASVTSDDPAALISIMPMQAEYLSIQIDGGVRRAGDPGTTASGPLVPGPDAKLDRHGNLPRGYIKRQLADPDVFWTTLGVSDKPALVRRDGDELKILALIVEQTEYEKRFDFFGIVQAGAEQYLAAEVSNALTAATRSSD